jgi:hypothetical protein
LTYSRGERLLRADAIQAASVLQCDLVQRNDTIDSEVLDGHESVLSGSPSSQPFECAGAFGCDLSADLTSRFSTQISVRGDEDPLTRQSQLDFLRFPEVHLIEKLVFPNIGRFATPDLGFMA